METMIDKTIKHTNNKGVQHVPNESINSPTNTMKFLQFRVNNSLHLDLIIYQKTKGFKTKQDLLTYILEKFLMENK
ncbi:MAG: hypothetical protein Q8P20_01120 [bacterium]|nr:hypothetical protein [bacterium]